MRSMADLSPTAHADLPAADEPPTLEAAALARALGRDQTAAPQLGQSVDAAGMVRWQ